MKEQLKLRLEALKQEFETGQTRLHELERQQVIVRETLLRISGAIQVLEEVIASSESVSEDAARPAEPEVAAAVGHQI